MYLLKVLFKIQGIPCLLGVKSIVEQKPFKGHPRFCESDMDYWGWSEVEYDILDRTGYKAEWLARKQYSEEAAKQAILNYEDTSCLP